jgi:hypothetical protein
LAKEFDEMERAITSDATVQINNMLNGAQLDYPKAQRALMFFAARPLQCYAPRRNVLMRFLQEIGVEISSERELGESEAELLQWFEKAENALTDGMCANFEKHEVMRRP